MTYKSKCVLMLVILCAASLGVTVTEGFHTAAQNPQRPRLVPSTSQQKPTSKPTPPREPDDLDADVIRVDTDLVNTVFTAVDQDRHFVTTLQANDLRVL